MTARAPAGGAIGSTATAAPGGRYKDFPPGWEHLLVPTSSRAAALAGLSLYAPCRTRAVLAHRAVFAALRIFGPVILPGPARPWESGMPEAVWLALVAEWSDRIGAFDEVAGYRRSVGRPGLSLLLLRRGAPLAFLKVRHDDPAPLESERRALELARAAPALPATVPGPLAAGRVESWDYLAMEPLPPQCHGPPTKPPLERIAAGIDEALAALERPDGIPGHWRPMHGDFTPWNLRQAGRTLFLMDWEDADWAPPGADLVLYRAVEAALGLGGAWRGAPAEATAFWLRRVRARTPRAERDRRLDDSLREVLEHMQGSPVPEHGA